MHHDNSLPENPNLQIDYSTRELRKIYLAGGCFWGSQAYLARVPGVAATSVGYANGRTIRPSYQDVCYNNTGHAETVEVTYDPAVVHLEDLLAQYFQIIDPTMLNRQGNDRGTQYRTGIYYTDPADLPVIENLIREEQEKYKLPIVTEVRPLERYDPAEDYHQDYLEKNPGGYCHVGFSTLPKGPVILPTIDPVRFQQQAAEPQVQSARSRDQKPVIDPSRFPRPETAVLRKNLTPLQYAVACENATEHPFTGAYWREERTGLYVDVATGEPLFSSKDKFDSGCGWPSFARPIEPAVVRENRDKSHGMERVEVRSRSGDIHLGHVFTDGPASRGGLRYCINSAAVRFIPLADLEREGYGDWVDYFRKPAETD